MALSLTKKKVDVRVLEDNRIFVVYENIILVESKLQKSNKTLKRGKKIGMLLNQSEYFFHWLPDFHEQGYIIKTIHLYQLSMVTLP